MRESGFKFDFFTRAKMVDLSHFCPQALASEPLFSYICASFFIYFSFILDGLGLDFGGSGVSFWEDFGGLEGPWAHLGTPWPTIFEF